jgi:hydroxypyruvate isomerase
VPGLPAGAQFAPLVANVQYAADQLQAHGLTLLLEPVALLPGFFIADARAALAAIDAAGRGNVRLQYDLFQMHLAGEDLAAQLRALLPRIGHLQLADAPGRHEPGTGNIDFATLLPLIDALGYRGAIGCEYLPRAGTVAGLGWARQWLAAGAGSGP